ncbi:MAG: hypothetical protein ACRDVN_06530 [Jiangellaceae bacterium]
MSRLAVQATRWPWRAAPCSRIQTVDEAALPGKVSKLGPWRTRQSVLHLDNGLLLVLDVDGRIPAERAFSRIFRNRRELIDHVMISRPLLLAGVTADSFVDDLIGITEDVDSRRDAVLPDHAPLWARINWP